ncbi:MAG: oxygen-dependent coproporphyrinogen oxidase [Bacteroidetes bacterium]|nr:oxygen-dependent coproporphyrinogen oxidase [Bacteroidota bacterium]
MNRTEIAEWLKQLQDNICSALENADGKSKFETETWTRPEGGGGRTRVIKNGAVLEKGGVAFSAVEGNAPEFLFREKEHAVSSPSPLGKDGKGLAFFATGVSIVIHPESPLVPTIHMNVRYFEMDNGVRWLGGGIDLTPHYVVENDAKYFHAQLKKVCDKHHPDYYKKFKTWADDYFYIAHRQETRGIGGIFFDRLNESADMSFEKNLAFWKDVGELFAPVYVEIINRNKNKTFSEQQKQWQLLRRGRYVEFNLVYDKGTKFGLETNGRTESILMSLPKFASWEYDYKPEKNSDEEKTLNLLKKGIEWV